MKILVAFSGGVESTALMHWCLNEGHEVIAFHWSNGHPHTTTERMFVQAWCDEHKVQLIRIMSLTNTDMMHEKLVPHKKNPLIMGWLPNAIMLAFQIPGLTHLAFGCNADTDTLSPMHKYLYRLDDAVLGYSGLNIKYILPLSHLTKKQQYEMVPSAWRERLIRCTDGSKCGHCNKCREYIATGIGLV